MSRLDRQILSIAGYSVAWGFLVALSLQLEFRLIGWLALAVMVAVVRWMWKNYDYCSVRAEDLMMSLMALAAGSMVGEGIWFEFFA